MSANSVRVVRCRRRLKLKAVAYLGGVCLKCGYSRCPDAFDFHHRDPTQKDFQIAGRGVYRRFDLLKKELDKCDLLCANCHRELHASLKEMQGTKRGRAIVPWPEAEELRQWVKTEKLASIGKRFGVHRATVRHWCKALGVPLPAHGSRFRPMDFVSRSSKRKVLWPPEESLGKMVWLRPVLHIAQDIGVSEVAVKKHCKRLGLPTPPRGYWASVRSKQRDTSG